MNKTIRKEIYISVDVEADGPIPGPYSLSSLGAFVAGSRDSNNKIERYDLNADSNRFYTEIKPISENFDPEAAAVAGLDRIKLLQEGEEPIDAMTRFAAWVEKAKTDNGANAAIFAAYPLGYDWMWTYWYLMQYSTSGSPFGHSRHVDMKTEFSSRSGALISSSIKSRMPNSLKPNLPHTHNALDDAVEQGVLFMNILEWNK
jgi:hypothetical protein